MRVVPFFVPRIFCKNAEKPVAVIIRTCLLYTSVLNDGSTVKAYYVDSIGFAELQDFFKERNMDLQKENLLNEELQEIEIFDKPGLFGNGRLRDEDVPELSLIHI